MKVWHLPPRYLDTTTLRSEFHVLKDLFERLADEEVAEYDRLTYKFYNHHKFIFIRLMAVHDELKKRGIKHYEVDVTDMLDDLRPDSREYRITLSDIQRDMNIINDIWEDSLLSNEIPALLELMSLSNAEDILMEWNCLFSEYEEEYDL